MKTISVLSLLALIAVGPASGQSSVDQVAANVGGGEPAVAAAAADSATVEEATSIFTAPTIRIANFRANDQRGLNVFEAPKDGPPFRGFELQFGGAFTQQFQALDHRNRALPIMATTAAGVPYNANELLDIGTGFNLATANLNLNAQLAPGIRVALESYMSSRHHNEFWVKGGYLQIDASPIDLPALHSIMRYVTLKAGMFELNYGDAHFRRSDNGNTIYNPFVENYLLDAFNTEIGAEVYVRNGPWLAMVGVTDGVNRGGVNLPDERSPAVLLKAGWDRQIDPDLRLRLTGSLYNVEKTPSSNLYAGDRTGSRYYSVMDNVQSTVASQFTSGRVNPGFSNEVMAFQFNPFLKYRGLELFGVVERAEGKVNSEVNRREWNQYAGDVVYRFLPREQLYLGARHNVVRGELRGIEERVSVDRTALSAGWFVTSNILVKGEYVRQDYSDFPDTDIRHGGRFDGFMMEGAVSF